MIRHGSGIRGWVLAAAFAAGLAAPLAAQESETRVVVEGGADRTGQQYEWKVTNRYTSPIVFIEFPHTRADMFTSPSGWIDQSTKIVGLPTNQPGTPMCRAEAESDLKGIQPGHFASFQARIADAGIKRGPGQMRFRFADGTVQVVDGVELPRGDTLLERHILKIGFGVMFAIFIGVQIFRARRRGAVQP